MIAYTRNPALLKALGNACGQLDVLQATDPTIIPHASVQPDNIAYHIGRYAPHGLYGNSDPADRTYNGTLLKERCKYLHDPTTALAVSTPTTGGAR